MKLIFSRNQSEGYFFVAYFIQLYYNLMIVFIGMIDIVI